MKRLYGVLALFAKPLPAWAILILCLAFSAIAARATVAIYAAQLQAITPNASSIPLRVIGFSGQSSNLQTWENSVGSVLSSMSAAGGFTGPTVTGTTSVTGGTLNTTTQVLASSGQVLALCGNATCTNAPHIGTTQNIVYPNGASSASSAFLCTSSTGVLGTCSWVINTALLSSGTCTAGQWCANILVGSFSSVGSFGCTASYDYHSGGVGNGIAPTVTSDFTTNQIYISVNNLTGSNVNFGTNPVTISYACPYFGS